MKRNRIDIEPTGAGGTPELVYFYNGRWQSYIPLPLDAKAVYAARVFIDAYNAAQPEE